MAGAFDTLQTLNSDIAELFGTWQDRLRETCNMTSPSGVSFSPLWAGSSRNFEKKIGRFNFPGVKGTYLQDLEVNGDVYPMTVFFEGKDHDKDARSFFAACKEKGKWAVTHPVHGGLTLQLVSVTQNDDPIGNGNITAFDLNFEESISLIDVQQQPKALLPYQVVLCNAAAAMQFASMVITDTFAAINTITNTIKSAKTIITAVLEPLRNLNTEIDNLFNQINSSINDTLDAAVLEPLVLAGQIQQLVQIPALIETSVESKIDMYENIVNQLFTEPISTATDLTRNQALVFELVSSACIVAIAQSAAEGSITSRIEAIGINENIYNTFINTTQNLDAIQILFRGQLAYKQYFSQSQSFIEIAKIVGLSLQHINALIFDLAVERKFTLSKYWNTWLLAATEYGGPGENDENIDLFIKSNNLHGNEILILPPGKEVVVYA